MTARIDDIGYGDGDEIADFGSGAKPNGALAVI